MIIVRTPVRVSFLGGGTDHPAWYRESDRGAVISTSIDKYVYMTLRTLPPVFDHRYRVAWSRLEECATADEVVHPVVRAILKNFHKDEEEGLEIVFHADLPARSGLGSSSAFTVAALNALMAHQGVTLTKAELAEAAIQVEQVFLKEPVGSQDQVAVAHGGLNRIDFRKSGRIDVEPIDISPRRKKELESQLLMVFTNFTRSASAIEAKKIESFASKTAQLNRMYDMVDEGQKILEDRSIPLADFGQLLHEGWMHKRGLASGVSNGPIDRTYEIAREAGAIGGKLLGAGGGGFLLFQVPPGQRDDVIEALEETEMEPGKPPVVIPFQFEESGSQVVLTDKSLAPTPFHRSGRIGKPRKVA
jgi:D-glycero-alpha-D-manno-heptose-7-phosphate kinase